LSPSSDRGWRDAAGALLVAVLLIAAPGLERPGLGQSPPPQPAAAHSAQQIENAASEAARALDLQLFLPLAADKPQPAPWRWSLPEWLKNWLNSVNFRLPTGFDSFVLWGVLAVIAGVVLYVFRDALPFWRPEGVSRDPGSGSIDPHAAKSHGEASLAAEELAAQGRYMEAMHVLLLRGLTEMRLHAGESFADSLTSREILRNTRLSQAGRESLRDIVARVEWSYFGEHPAALADYAACRDSYDRLIAALHGPRSHEPRSHGEEAA
jgi:hypothetical protein